MADQNQGASIEAERRDFEEWTLGPANDWLPSDIIRNSSGNYANNAVLCQWEGWLERARRSVPPAAGELPPLPKWIDDQKGKDPFMDDVITYIIDLRAQLAAKGQGNVKFDLTDYNRAVNYANGTSTVVIAPASAQPADPMDWPIPCDVKVGGCTIRKGCKLRTLVTRMESLHRMAIKAFPQPTPEALALVDSMIAGTWKPEDGAQPDQRESAAESESERDPLYDKAVQVVRAMQRASLSLVQRHLMIGYNRTARLFEAMEKAGVVSAHDENGHRTVLAQQGQDSANNGAEGEKA